MAMHPDARDILIHGTNDEVAACLIGLGHVDLGRRLQTAAADFKDAEHFYQTLPRRPATAEEIAHWSGIFSEIAIDAEADAKAFRELGAAQMRVLNLRSEAREIADAA